MDWNGRALGAILKVSRAAWTAFGNLLGMEQRSIDQSEHEDFSVRDWSIERYSTRRDRFSNAILEQSIRVGRRYRSRIIAHHQATTSLRGVFRPQYRRVGQSWDPGILLSAISNCAFSSRVSCGVRDRLSVCLSVSGRSFVRSLGPVRHCLRHEQVRRLRFLFSLLGEKKKGDWYTWYLARSRG